MTHFSRRDFIAATAGSVALTPLVARATMANDVPWAKEKVVDCHFHARPTDEAMIAHLDGAGISNALVLATEDYSERMKVLHAHHHGRMLGWARGSLTAPVDANGQVIQPGGPFPFMSADDNVKMLRQCVGKGAKGFAETVGLVDVDGRELQRIYALAAELDVPVMMHFQQATVPGQPRYGISGFSRIEPMLKKYPRTRFICHASDFWGNIDASYTDGGAYPSGKVNKGGLADRLLANHDNIFGDFSAPSGLVQLSRDPDFTSDFLQRHQHKLIFGSDCGCPDGNGGKTVNPTGQGVNDLQQKMAQRGGFAGKCIARELLTIAWNGTPRSVFRKLAYENGVKTYRLRG